MHMCARHNNWAAQAAAAAVATEVVVVSVRILQTKRQKWISSITIDTMHTRIRPSRLHTVHMKCTDR